MIWHWDKAILHKQDLMAAIARRRQTDRGIVATNVGGWHSRRDVPDWPEAVTRELVTWVKACAAEFTRQWCQDSARPEEWAWHLNGWANVNPAGASNASHKHPQAQWQLSACYYLDLGDLKNGGQGGELVFEDRITGLVARSPNNLRTPVYPEWALSPREGMLVMFPSWLYHRVEAHTSSRERISLAFNLGSPMLRENYWARQHPKHPNWRRRYFGRVLNRIRTFAPGLVTVYPSSEKSVNDMALDKERG